MNKYIHIYVNINMYVNKYMYVNTHIYMYISLCGCVEFRLGFPNKTRPPQEKKQGGHEFKSLIHH